MFFLCLTLFWRQNSKTFSLYLSVVSQDGLRSVIIFKIRKYENELFKLRQLVSKHSRNFYDYENETCQTSTVETYIVVIDYKLQARFTLIAGLRHIQSPFVHTLYQFTCTYFQWVLRKAFMKFRDFLRDL